MRKRKDGGDGGSNSGEAQEDQQWHPISIPLCIAHSPVHPLGEPQQPLWLPVRSISALAIHFTCNSLPSDTHTTHILTSLRYSLCLNNNISKRPFVTTLYNIVSHLWHSPSYYPALFCFIFSNYHHLIYGIYFVIFLFAFPV